jgi:hypothetical protein
MTGNRPVFSVLVVVAIRTIYSSPASVTWAVSSSR